MTNFVPKMYFFFFFFFSKTPPGRTGKITARSKDTIERFRVSDQDFLKGKKWVEESPQLTTAVWAIWITQLNPSLDGVAEKNEEGDVIRTYQYHPKFYQIFFRLPKLRFYRDFKFLLDGRQKGFPKDHQWQTSKALHPDLFESLKNSFGKFGRQAEDCITFRHFFEAFLKGYWNTDSSVPFFFHCWNQMNCREKEAWFPDGIPNCVTVQFKIEKNSQSPSTANGHESPSTANGHDAPSTNESNEGGNNAGEDTENNAGEGRKSSAVADGDDKTTDSSTVIDDGKPDPKEENSDVRRSDRKRKQVVTDPPASPPLRPRIKRRKTATKSVEQTIPQQMVDSFVKYCTRSGANCRMLGRLLMNLGELSNDYISTIRFQTYQVKTLMDKMWEYDRGTFEFLQRHLLDPLLYDLLDVDLERYHWCHDYYIKTSSLMLTDVSDGEDKSYYISFTHSKELLISFTRAVFVVISNRCATFDDDGNCIEVKKEGDDWKKVSEQIRKAQAYAKFIAFIHEDYQRVCYYDKKEKIVKVLEKSDPCNFNFMGSLREEDETFWFNTDDDSKRLASYRNSYPDENSEVQNLYDSLEIFALFPLDAEEEEEVDEEDDEVDKEDEDSGHSGSSSGSESADDEDENNDLLSQPVPRKHLGSDQKNAQETSGNKVPGEGGEANPSDKVMNQDVPSEGGKANASVNERDEREEEKSNASNQDLPVSL